jgi:hypothetical protein
MPSARITMPGPPPAGVSSTARWRPVPCSRMSRASSNHRLRASASPTSDWPSGCWKQGKDRAREHRATLYAFGRSLSRIIFGRLDLPPRIQLTPSSAERAGREHSISRRRRPEEPRALDPIRGRNSSTPAVRKAQIPVIRQGLANGPIRRRAEFWRFPDGGRLGAKSGLCATVSRTGRTDRFLTFALSYWMSGFGPEAQALRRTRTAMRAPFFGRWASSPAP